MKQNRWARLENKGEERILGNGLFVEEVLRQTEAELGRRADYADQGIDFGVQLIQVAQQFDLEPEDLLRPGKQPARVKGLSLVCYWAARELGMTATDLARKLGLTQSAVSRAVHRGEKLASENGISFPAGNALSYGRPPMSPY